MRGLACINGIIMPCLIQQLTLQKSPQQAYQTNSINQLDLVIYQDPYATSRACIANLAYKPHVVCCQQRYLTLIFYILLTMFDKCENKLLISTQGHYTYLVTKKVLVHYAWRALLPCVPISHHHVPIKKAICILQQQESEVNSNTLK